MRWPASVIAPAEACHSPITVRSVEELLWIYGLPGAPSFPKSRMVALLLENIHADAAAHLASEGYKVETLSDALPEDELIRSLKGVSILGIRSKTRVTAGALAAADRLLAIGCFCIGTEQVDLARAGGRGVAVLNAPYSNTRSVVELAIGEIVMLMRRAVESDRILHAAQSLFHDHLPGQRLGLTTVWVDRRQGRPGSGEGVGASAGLGLGAGRVPHGGRVLGAHESDAVAEVPGDVAKDRPNRRPHRAGLGRCRDHLSLGDL